MSARFLQRIVCFHSDVDFGVVTHLERLPVQPHEGVDVAFGPRRQLHRPNLGAALTGARGVHNRGFGSEVTGVICRVVWTQMSAWRWGTRVWEVNDE